MSDVIEQLIERVLALENQVARLSTLELPRMIDSDTYGDSSAKILGTDADGGFRADHAEFGNITGAGDGDIALNNRILTSLPQAAAYSTNAAQSIDNASWEIVNFEDAVVDNFSLVTIGAAWKFTAPVAGLYLVTASILYDATNNWASNEAAVLAVYVDGAAYCHLDRRDGPAAAQTIYMMLQGTVLVSLAASSYLDVRAYQNSGGGRVLINDGSYNRIGIARIA